MCVCWDWRNHKPGRRLRLSFNEWLEHSGSRTSLHVSLTCHFCLWYVSPQTAAYTAPDEAAIAPNEPAYCICKRVSCGEMVGCDNDDCETEWFHFGCVGLKEKVRVFAACGWLSPLLLEGSGLPLLSPASVCVSLVRPSMFCPPALYGLPCLPTPPPAQG